MKLYGKTLAIKKKIYTFAANFKMAILPNEKKENFMFNLAVCPTGKSVGVQLINLRRRLCIGH